MIIKNCTCTTGAKVQKHFNISTSHWIIKAPQTKSLKLHWACTSAFVCEKDCKDCLCVCVCECLCGSVYGPSASSCLLNMFTDPSDESVAAVRHIVQSILVPCVFVIGLIGNSVSIYVLTRWVFFYYFYYIKFYASSIVVLFISEQIINLLILKINI